MQLNYHVLPSLPHSLPACHFPFLFSALPLLFIRLPLSPPSPPPPTHTDNPTTTPSFSFPPSYPYSVAIETLTGFLPLIPYKFSVLPAPPPMHAHGAPFLSLYSCHSLYWIIQALYIVHVYYPNYCIAGNFQGRKFPWIGKK